MTRYPQIQTKISPSVTLVVVTKGRSYEEVYSAYEEGARHFGENRVPEALEKISQLPSDIHWHFIGSLQKNKVRKVLGHFDLIHSVDSLELAKKISEVSEEMGRTTSILLQANTSGEEAKHGYAPEQWISDFKALLRLPSLDVQGLMTMAPLTEDEDTIRRCFAGLRSLRDSLQDSFGRSLPHLSMGMSNDYRIAIEEGATLVRIGSAIFNQ